jgi:tRNA A-37 threonylcarbamoyl transferase component Bud32
MPARLQLIARTGHPDFLDLPWDEPLEEWRHERLVEVVRGIHRHVVRFVEYEGSPQPKLYALKELPVELARREYRLLRALAADEMPVVEAVGVVSDRGGDLDAVLITRHLDYSLPFRTLFARGSVPDLRRRLLDAAAELLVRLHLGGFFWGDCSLSNTLFRRDAGSLAAYLVDAETGELHPSLSSGQRAHDLQIAEENVAGELADVEAELGRDGELRPEETAADLVERYESLWDELTREEAFGDDTRFKIDDRLRRLNELGFDVDELELVAGEDGYRLRLNPRVVEPGHHRRRLHALTGLTAQENQARRLLNDLARYRAELDRSGGRPVPETVAIHRWLSEVFEPAVAAIPSELWGKRDAAEVFHEALEHRWFLSQEANADVGLMPAVEAYVDDVLRHAADERAVLEPASTHEDEPGEDGVTV